MNTENMADVNATKDTSETIDEVKDEISQVSDAGADAARDISGSQFEQGRDKATDQLDSASEAIGEVADKLQQNDSPFASYASELSEQMSSFSSRLSTSSIDDLVGGARSLARENPAAFMLGSMAIGLAASRFFKATGEQVSGQESKSDQGTQSQHGDYRSSQRTGYTPGNVTGTAAESDVSDTYTSVADVASTPRTPGSHSAFERDTTDSVSQDSVSEYSDRTSREEA